MEKVVFRQYVETDQETCLGMFDANCPEYFAPNERADYLQFLDACPAGYELCEASGKVMGAFGVFDRDGDGKDLNWILLDPDSQGQGLGSIIMRRVTTSARDSGGGVVHIAASHKSAPFFARFGARITLVTDHGWGTNMHRVDMELRL